MASAVLASRNEPYWGERKVYMRKYPNNSTNTPHLTRFNPNPNPSFNPNPSPNRRAANVRQSHEPSPRSALPPPSNDSPLSLNRRVIAINDQKESLHGRYVTIRLASCSRRELKEIKKRLISELERVRSLRSRIETREVVPPLSGSFGRGRELVCPPPLQLNHDALHSPVAAADPKEKRTPKTNQHCSISEFGTGKNKKISGHKRTPPFPSGGDRKRPAMLHSPVEKLITTTMKRCRQILAKLMKHRHGWVFNTPVDAVSMGLHDYHQIIRAPMDLGTVKSRLEKNEYGSPLDFASDVRLTFNNAMTYNPKGQDVYVMAETMLSQFDDMFNPAYQKFASEHRLMVIAEQANPKIRGVPRNVAPENVSRRVPDSSLIPKKSDIMHLGTTLSNPPPVQVQASTAQTAKQPKPKAKNPNKRQMSFEEKAKLGVNLQNMPAEGMDQLVQIIKRNSKLAHDGDEIELDLETIDNDTLWELDRFVRHHKKAVCSKARREGLISNSNSTGQMNKLLDCEAPPETGIQRSKKGDAVEEDVDIGDEIPISNFPLVEIEKDDAACRSSRSNSSSSSSSSSDSSSSGDSGSSSGSDSDADSVKSPFVESREAPVT